VALTALAVGGVQFLSLPSETHPRPIWWLPPAIAVVATGLLPTDAPFWLDRLVSGAALAVGVSVLLLIAVTVVGALRAPRPAPARSRG
jgi:hypothetical protein